MSDSLIDKYRGKSVAPAPRPESKDLGFTSEPSTSLRMIDLVLKNGDRTALPYAYLVQTRLRGGASIELTFTESVVTITGRGMAVLYKHLLAQTASCIGETASGFDDDRLQTWVEAITIKPRDGA